MGGVEGGWTLKCHICSCALGKALSAARDPSLTKVDQRSSSLITSKVIRTPGTSFFFFFFFSVLARLVDPLDDSLMGTSHQKDQAMAGSLEFPAPPPFSREERRVEMGSIIDQAYVRKPP